jgi:hypothetical protein
MAKKNKNELIFSILSEIEDKLSKIDEKINKKHLHEDIYIEIDEKNEIIIPEALYLEICSELGEDFLRFMGIS